MLPPFQGYGWDKHPILLVIALPLITTWFYNTNVGVNVIALAEEFS